MINPPLRLQSPVGNNLKNDPEDIHDLALSLEGAGGPPASDAAKLGVWDQSTRNGVIDFQRRHELKVDGALLPGGQTEQNINKIVDGNASTSGRPDSAAIANAAQPALPSMTEPDAKASKGVSQWPSAKMHSETRAGEPLRRAEYRSVTPTEPETAVETRLDGEVKPRSVTNLAWVNRSKVDMSNAQDADAAERNSASQHGLMPIADKPMTDNGRLGLSRKAGERNKSDLPSVKRASPTSPAEHWGQTIKRGWKWITKPIPELVEQKRRMLARVDRLIDEASDPTKFKGLGRYYRYIAIARLEQTRSEIELNAPTSALDLTFLGFDIIGVVGSGSKALIAFRKGNRIFFSNTVTHELKLLPPPKMEMTHLHHIFPRFGDGPKLKKYRDFFKAREIHIHLYTVRLSQKQHLNWIHGNRNQWNREWIKWIDKNPNASTDDVYRFASELMYRHAIDDKLIEIHWPLHGKRNSRRLGHTPPGDR
jgi:hypothetical protein